MDIAISFLGSLQQSAISLQQKAFGNSPLHGVQQLAKDKDTGSSIDFVIGRFVLCPAPLIIAFEQTPSFHSIRCGDM
jgi:hypothetical protein